MSEDTSTPSPVMRELQRVSAEHREVLALLADRTGPLPVGHHQAIMSTLRQRLPGPASPMDAWKESIRDRATEMADDIRRMLDRLDDYAHPNHTATRVNAWLDAHAAWVDASPDRLRLAEQWRACARMFGADSDPALGVLLGLVRLAWGSRTYTLTERETGLTFQTFGRGGVVIESGDVLLAALEAAPC